MEVDVITESVLIIISELSDQHRHHQISLV